MMILNREKLEGWKEREGRSWTWVARKLSIQPVTLYNQLAGRHGVSLKTALGLEEITGIPIRSLIVEEVASA